ncbi:MAG: glycosyltransferase [Verrucomicrobia bacterium]|nr:MAG: glycosyltransferase [Verrucomicrobiota bacterium]
MSDGNSSNAGAAPGWKPRVLVLPASCEMENRTIGGGERYAAEYTRALARMTPAEQLLLAREVGPPPDGSPPSRVLPTRRFFSPLVPPFTRATWRALAGYDVLHVMCFPSPVSDGLLLGAALRGQTVVLTDVGGGGRCVGTYLTRLALRLNPYRRVHGHAHLSAYASRLFAGWPGEHTVLLGGARHLATSVDPGSFGGYALFVGRLLPHKGVREVIEALPDGRELRVVGRPYDPAYFESLRAAATGKNVRFVTDADDAEVARQYAGANVVLQPSLPGDNGAEDRSELLGLVAIEAQAAGKPVIVTRTTSLPELVDDGRTGFVVPPRDRAALRAALERLLGEPGLAARMGVAALAHARANFTWDAVARRGLEFYRQVAGRGHDGTR